MTRSLCFATSKPNGTGFGLPLAAKIVESEHGGRLSIDSVKGRGTIVRIIIPEHRQVDRRMKERHIALIVEDDRETAEDLVEILRSIDCDSVVTDNRDEALVELQNKSFCLILLDLQIKGAPDSIKGHIEYGKALLRKIREKHGDHNGTAFWVPVLIVSGFAREVDEAVDIMKDGASDVIQKPLNSRQVSERIRHALQAAGRQTHERCHEPPPTQVSEPERWGRDRDSRRQDSAPNPRDNCIQASRCN